jgi:hypothetical protein
MGVRVSKLPTLMLPINCVLFNKEALYIHHVQGAHTAVVLCCSLAVSTVCLMSTNNGFIMHHSRDAYTALRPMPAAADIIGRTPIQLLVDEDQLAQVVHGAHAMSVVVLPIVCWQSST